MEKARQELENAGYAWDSKGAIYYPEGKTDDKVLRKGDPVPEKK
jgi:hypothetical protein